MEFDKATTAERLKEYIEEDCLICHKRDWVLMDKVWQLEERGTDSEGFKFTMPVIALICGNCGHIVLFNAIAAGAVSKV